MTTEILNELKRDTLRNILAQNKRFDERGMYEYRPWSVQPNVVPNAEGSALVHLGKTQVLAAVKFGLGTPFPDRPKEGVFATNAELLPSASSLFEPGPPSAESIELARVVDRGIRSAEVMDLASFFIDDEKVLMLFLDVYVLDHDGNLIDAAALAGMSALLNTRMPKVEEGKIIYGEYAGTLPIKEKVTTCTFAKVDEHFLLDPSLNEERGMDGRLTLATTADKVCAGQKGGWAAVKKEELLNLIDISLEKGKELKAAL